MIDERFLDILKSKLSEIEDLLDIDIHIDNVVDGSRSKTFTFTAKEKATNKELESMCKKVGFNHNVIGMGFKLRGKNYKIISVDNKKRKYKVQAVKEDDGRLYGFTVSYIKKLLGGDVYINRIKVMEKILNEKKK